MTYSIITRDVNSGFDEKEDNIRDMATARTIAKGHMNSYDTVFVLAENKIQRVFDSLHRNGRRPYPFEYSFFTF